jgi:hypothetical protein
LFFLFDLAAGSLALKKYTLAEGTYGKKHAEIHEAREADTKEGEEQEKLLFRGAPKLPVPQYEK